MGGGECWIVGGEWWIGSGWWLVRDPLETSVGTLDSLDPSVH